MKKEKIILGLTCFMHDASACIIKDNKLIAFAEEERFNYEKHSGQFPKNAIQYCLDVANIRKNELTDIAFYFNLKKCLVSYLIKNNPLALLYNFDIFKRKRFFYEALWLTKLYINIALVKKFLGNENIKFHFVDHHKCHAWYGIYSSHLESGIVLSNDSMGEDISTLGLSFDLSYPNKKNFKVLLKQDDPNSLGYLYGAVTEFLGYKRGDGEGKVMALASFGTNKYLDYFEEKIFFQNNGKFSIDKSLVIDRSFKPQGARLANDFFRKFGEPKTKEEEFTQHHFDIAYALQNITERLLDHQVNYISNISNCSNIIFTGGVAQNSVANGIISNKYPSIRFIVPPIPHDAGCSIGAAIAISEKLYQRMPEKTETAFLGEKFSDKQIIEILENSKIAYKSKNNIVDFMVEELSSGKVIAIFRKEMEGGPRALCHRSIIADPSFKNMLEHLNKRVKFREYFRPYGGFILKEDVPHVLEYKNKYIEGPYMSFVYSVRPEWQNRIPSLVHVDKTCRIQIIPSNGDQILLTLLKNYKEKTGIPLLINTSFNIRGLPICRSPQDALSAFYSSSIDTLIFNDKIIIQK